MKSRVHGVSAFPLDQGQRMDTQRTLEDPVRFRGVLQDLCANMSMTLLVWNDFCRVDGHVSFFLNMTTKDANISLENITRKDQAVIRRAGAVGTEAGPSI